MEIGRVAVVNRAEEAIRAANEQRNIRQRDEDTTRRRNEAINTGLFTPSGEILYERHFLVQREESLQRDDEAGGAMIVQGRRLNVMVPHVLAYLEAGTQIP